MEHNWIFERLGTTNRNGGLIMLTRNKNVYKLIYNGPHLVNSTSPMGFSVTVRNIATSSEEVQETDTHELVIGKQRIR